MRKTGDQHDEFSTDWSLVLQAQSADPRRRQAALAVLLQFYHRAFLAHLIYRMRIEPALADDLIQGYIADKILERDLLVGATPTKGRLRNLLLRSLQNYAIDQIRRTRRDVRAAGGELGDEEHCASLADAEMDEIDPFDAAWGREVLGQALRAMRDKCFAKGFPERWQLFECRVLAPLTGRSRADSYDVLVKRFGFKSPQQATNVLATAKRQFRRALESVLQQYCDAGEVADELAELCQILGKSAQPSGAIAEFLDAQVATYEDVGMKSTGKLAAECLAAIVSSQPDNDSDWSEADLAAMWRQLLELSQAFLLSHPLYKDSDVLSTNACLLPTIGALLRGPHATASELKGLKDWARNQVRQGDGGLPRELASAVYFASIAAARLHHGQRISKLDDSVLRYGLEACRNKTWLDDATGQVIAATLAALQEGNDHESKMTAPGATAAE
jgi:DNA-directed RNA polymerase specialized sigma24 family protein